MRKIERHSSNQGSVITFDMYGKTVQLFVADAKYRTATEWCVDTDINSLDKFKSAFIAINPTNKDDDKQQELQYEMPDEQLQARFPAFKTDKTAKENTDILMQYEDTKAAHWCRSQNISGVGQLDLPNIYELMIIYLESDRIDELDPTVNDYKQYALGMLNYYGRFNFNDSNHCCSSTKYNGMFVRTVDYSSVINCQVKFYILGVIPVKEL